MPNGAVTKELFRNAIKYIIIDYEYREKDLIRRDYITRTIIILIEKYKLNEEFKTIEYSIFRDELEKTIALMAGIININVVREIENSIEAVEELEEIKEKSSESIQNNAYSIDNSEDFPEIDDSIIENNDEIIEY